MTEEKEEVKHAAERTEATENKRIPVPEHVEPGA
jgi:hypothetical protein